LDLAKFLPASVPPGRLMGKKCGAVVVSYFNPKRKTIMTIQSISLSQLKASTENPRKTFDQTSIEGLALSIKQDGLLQNLVVAKPKGKQKFIIIAGERRFRALQYLLDKGEISNDYAVQVEVKEGLTEQETFRIATVENVQRENLPPVEEAEAIAALLQEGMVIDDVAAQTGLSISTINRRLALSNLCKEAKKALSAKKMTLSQAEALTLGTVKQQREILRRGIERMDAESIRECLTDEKVSISLAIFPLELYKGTLTKDLFASEESTYFDDTEQFLNLQKQAVEKLVEEYKAKGFAPVTVLEDEYFKEWQYRTAKKKTDKKGGVVIEFRNGNVQVHAGIVPIDLDKRTREVTAKSPISDKKTTLQYGRPLCEYIAMHKSMAVQKALLDNRRVAKEVAVILMMERNNISIKAHGCLAYFEKAGTNPLAYIGIEEIGRTLAIALGIEISEGSSVWSTILHWHEGDLYTAVKALTDEKLDDLHLFLSTLTFGQENNNFLDSREDSLFNRVAKDLDVDMHNFWMPDEDFLNRRNKAQLDSLMVASGTKNKFGNLGNGKKSELVKKLADYFKSLLTKNVLTDEEQHTRNWVPEVMHFPAIDADAAARPQEPESEDFSEDEDMSDEN
jgi:ParB family chromosome partitioning protein